MRKQLLESIKNQNELACRCALRSFSILNAVGQAESIIDLDVVCPLIEKHCTPSKSNRDSSKEIVDNFNELYNDLNSQIIMLIKQSYRIGGQTKFKFVEKSVWSRIRITLLEKQKDMFFPRFSEVFHKQYTETFKLFRRLQCMCTYDNALKLFNVPENKEFRKKWYLPIYFQLRFQQIVGNIEKNLKVEILENDKQFCISISKVIHTSIVQCWDNKIYIKELSNRFLKLNLEIIGRFITIIRCVIDNKEHEQNTKFLPLLCDVNTFKEAELFQDIVKEKLGDLLTDKELSICYQPFHEKLNKT
eukprot:UN24987